MPKNTPLIKDWLAFGFATGSVLSLLKTAASTVLGEAGFHTMPFGDTATSLLLGRKKGGFIPRSKKVTREEKTLGVVVDTLMGGAYGAATTCLISLSPPGNEMSKGAMAGALFSIFTTAVGRMLRIDGLRTVDAPEALSMIVSGTVFGALQGLALARYGSGMIVQSHPVLVKPTSDREFRGDRLRVSPTHS